MNQATTPATQQDKMNQATTPATQQDKPKAFFTIADLMERWQVGRTTIYKEIERGRLKRKHIAGAVRFAAEEVARYEATA